MMQSTELNRKQFTFYRSYLEAVKKLPKCHQFEVLEAIIEYSLDGATSKPLSSKVEAVFTAVRPTLDVARVKAQNRIRAVAEANRLPSGSK